MRIAIRRVDRGAGRSAAEHLDALLDAALADSFPASDPVAIGHAYTPPADGQRRTAEHDPQPASTRAAAELPSPYAPSAR